MKTKAVIYVEGVADVKFVSDYLFHLQLIPKKEDDTKSKRIEIETSHNELLVLQSIEGITNLLNFAQDMKRNNNEGIQNLVFLDADKNYSLRQGQIIADLNSKDIIFNLFLAPNNKDNGALEDLLEKIINNQNKSIFVCWDHYEAELSQQQIAWKSPNQPTTPAKKTKIYGYLEALHGESKSEKEKIKESKRDYNDSNLWDLDAKYLEPLKNWLMTNLS